MMRHAVPFHEAQARRDEQRPVWIVWDPESKKALTEPDTYHNTHVWLGDCIHDWRDRHDGWDPDGEDHEDPPYESNRGRQMTTDEALEYLANDEAVPSLGDFYEDSEHVSSFNDDADQDDAMRVLRRSVARARIDYPLEHRA